MITKQDLAQKLKSVSECPSLEAEWIYQETTNEKKILNILMRRLKFEPLSKIFGKKAFWRGNFSVSKDVLDPRPDSETLIRAVLDILPNKTKPYSFLDIATGSGCLLVSLLMEYPNAKGTGLDISPKALSIARKNLKTNKVKAFLHKKDMRALSLLENYDFAVSNPPYIPTKDLKSLDKSVRFYDPKIALDGGKDGLDYYRVLSQIKGLPLLFVEIGINQKKQVQELFQTQNWRLKKTYCDYGGIERVLVFQKKIEKSKKKS